MSNQSAFPISRQGFDAVALSAEDAAHLQTLFDQCADFFVMTNGEPAIPTAAVEEFTDVPDGKMPEDVQAFGLLGDQNRLTGTIIGVQGYPDLHTWWIGLMLMAPEYRGQGLGTVFYEAFEQWLASQGYRFISLCTIAPNVSGRQFWQQMGFEEIRKTPLRPYGSKSHEVYVYRRTIEKSLVNHDSKSSSEIPS